MSVIPSSALVCVLLFSGLGPASHAASPKPVIDLRASLQPTPVRMAEDGFVSIAGVTSLPADKPVTIEVTRGTGGVSKTEVKAIDGKFTCRYPTDFKDAPALSPCLLYIDASAGGDLLQERAEVTLIVTGKSTRPDLPSAFTDDFLDAQGAKDSAAPSWPLHRTMVNLFMKSRGAKLAGVGRADFDLAEPADFARFKHMATLYDFDHRDRDWSAPLNHRVARAFWQAEWNRWFGPGNDHPWDGDSENRRPENFRPYTFTNDLADLLILHQMRRSLPRATPDNRDAMCDEALANLLALQHRGTENFALAHGEHYTAGAFRYGFFETGEWLAEGTGWFVNPKAGDHRKGGVFNGRSAWALGESLKRNPSGIHAKKTAEALARVARYCLHDGLAKNYTRTVGHGLPFWKQAGEHGYLTLGMLAASEVKPNQPILLGSEKPLADVTAEALNALVAATNSDGHWTKYPDQDAMALAALAEGALIFPKHPDAPAWRNAAIRAADGWLAAKHDPAERASECAHFGRREGSRMTYRLGENPEVHLNLYISGLWLHALAKTYHLTGDARYRHRAEGILGYLCGDNPFHARLLNELGAVFNIIRDTDDERSRLSWDCYPESTAFVQIGLLHWLDAIQSKP